MDRTFSAISKGCSVHPSMYMSVRQELGNSTRELGNFTVELRNFTRELGNDWGIVGGELLIQSKGELCS